MLRLMLLVVVSLSAACGPASHRVVMSAENNSGQSGFALLTPLSGGRTRVELDILPGNDPRKMAAHVHDGRCGEIGGIAAGLKDLESNTAANGHFTSTTEIALSLDAMLKGTYAINVHDARDFSLYVSCGEIK
ncbi:MAG: CHRD domain-containing protein [Myxococcales bacterium]|nr:CHRD domain-containing protein [Myxococcales bacterium]